MKKLTPFLFASLFVLITIINLSCKSKKHRRTVIYYCMAGGSSVTMGDGTAKMIEDLKVHDTIMDYDRVKNKFIPSVVEALASTQHEGFVRLCFSGLYVNKQNIAENTLLTLTQDHPVWVKDKGWCSNAPELTKRIQAMPKVNKYSEGDIGYGYRGKEPKEITLEKIENVKGIIKAYTVVSLQNKLDCFVVNGIVVGIEPRRMEDGGE